MAVPLAADAVSLHFDDGHESAACGLDRLLALARRHGAEAGRG